MINVLLKVKPGDDVTFAGTATLEGVDDWTGHTIEANFCLKQLDHTPGGANIGSVAGNWLNTTTGTLTIPVLKSITSTWPINSAVLMDVTFTSPTGLVMTTDTGEFITTERVP